MPSGAGTQMVSLSLPGDLAPKCNVSGSNQFATSPAISFRWDYERGWSVTQGMILQGFRDPPVFNEKGAAGEPESGPPVPVSYVRPTISDGDHVSARWKRITIGGTFE